MELTYFLTTLGLIPYITSRAFVPLFASALIARFGAAWMPLADLAGVQLLDSVPGWTVSDPALMSLGILALAEVLGNKSPELRQFLSLTDAQVKGLAAVIFCLALAPAASPRPASDAAAAENVFARRVWTRDARSAAPRRSKTAATSRPISPGCKEISQRPCSCCC